MAVAHQAATVVAWGNTGATGIRQVTHAAGVGVTPDWVLLFLFRPAAAMGGVTSIEYGGAGGVPLTSVGVEANDTATEACSVQAYFSSAGGWGSGDQNVRLTAQATTEYAWVCISGSGTACEVTGTIIEEENQALTEENVNDGSPGTNSVRYCGAYWGAVGLNASPGANSTALGGSDRAAASMAAARETTAGQGSRPVGFSKTSDDVAAIYLAVREAAAGVASQFISIIVGL